MIVPDYDAIFRFVLIIVAIVVAFFGIRYLISKKKNNNSNSNDRKYNQSNEVFRKRDDREGR